VSAPRAHGASVAVRARADRTLAARVVTQTSLPGITSGSALLRVGADLIAVHDDAFRLSRIALPTLAVTPLVLAGDGAPLAKKIKPDFESALFGADGVLHLLGSGSAPGRRTFARVDVRNFAVSFAERADVYRCVQDALASPAPPNVEGAVVTGERLRLFHRGVGVAPSAIVDVPLAVLDGGAPSALGVQTFRLGELDGVALGFTDAALTADGRLLFVAAAEDAADAVADGPVSGSVIGLIGLIGEAGPMGSIEPIGSDAGRAAARWTRIVGAGGEPWSYKVEGLALDDDLRGAWILTDADDPGAPTVLARLELRGFGR
jgi:hypothetical protein